MNGAVFAIDGHQLRTWHAAQRLNNGTRRNQTFLVCKTKRATLAQCFKCDRETSKPHNTVNHYVSYVDNVGKLVSYLDSRQCGGNTV
jgi:hypothetical protein